MRRLDPDRRSRRPRASLSPSERVRRAVARVRGDAVAARLPAGYHRMGRVLLLRLPAELRPAFEAIGAAWQRELGVETVLTTTGPFEGEARRPRVEVIAGGPTETEVVEYGVRFRFDAARSMFARGNRTERHRAALLVEPGETVVDLFAGIGYFAIPAALSGKPRRVVAVEREPASYRALLTNIRLNGVAEVVRPLFGDNRTVELPSHAADRIFLGYLPSAVPWVPRALDLARPRGAVLHLHAVGDVRGGDATLLREIRTAVEAAGGRLRGPPTIRAVKPYGPGREHWVADVTAIPGS